MFFLESNAADLGVSVCLNPTIADICQLKVEGAMETFSVLKVIALQKRKLISLKSSFDIPTFSSVKV